MARGLAKSMVDRIIQGEIQNLTYLFSCEDMCAQFDFSKSSFSEGLAQDVMADSVSIIAAAACAVGLLAAASG